MAEQVTVKDGIASFIRTAVPIGVGLGLTWIGRETGVVLDDGSSAGLTSGVAALAGAAYYAVVRAAETRWPALGWLLGLAVSPTYSKQL